MAMRSKGKHARVPTRAQRAKRAAARVALALCAALVALAFGLAALVGVACLAGDESALRALIPQVGAIEASPEDGRTAMYEGKRYRERPGMTSILLLGHDAAQAGALNGEADFVMVAAIDTRSAKTTLIYIPRDTMVDVERTYSGTDEYSDTVRLQIAAAFAYGSDFEHAAERMEATVSRLLSNLPIDYYLMLDVDGVGALADAVGGVELVALEDVPKTDLREGEACVLSGDLARQYVVERDEAQAWSAGARLMRQRQFVGAVADQLVALAKADPLALLGVFDAMEAYVLTDLGPSEMAYLASMYLRHGMGDLQAITLEGESAYNEQTGYEEYAVDDEAVLEALIGIYFEEA